MAATVADRRWQERALLDEALRPGETVAWRSADDPPGPADLVNWKTIPLRLGDELIDWARDVVDAYLSDPLDLKRGERMDKAIAALEALVGRQGSL